MKFEINNMINRNKNRPCVFLALGGSIGKYDLNEIIKDKIVVTCNMWFRYFDIVPDYWVLSNTVLTVPKMNEKLNEIYDGTKPVLCYADSVDLTSREIVSSLLGDKDYFPYDQRHFIGKKCPTPGFVNGKKCCEHRINERKTIQEELMNYCNYHEHFSTGDTVSVYALSICILLGCNPIEVYGLDLDYRTGYPKTLSTFNMDKYPHEKVVVSGDTFDPFKNNTMKDLNIIINSAKNIGIDIRCLH